MVDVLPADRTETVGGTRMSEDGSDQDDLCRYLDWDSSFFGFEIAAVNSSIFTKDNVAGIAAWCEAQKIRCLYYLAESTDMENVRLAEHNQFHLVDIRVTLERELGADSVTARMYETIRPAQQSDIPALKIIAAASHRDSRFYSDKGFPTSSADQLYRAWIEKSCLGYADKVLVAEHNGRVAGYISCHLDGEGKGRIGLLAVSANAQGRGHGTKLVSSALLWFAESGVQDVTVVTQGRNIAAQRLYQRCGFTTQSVQLWYHRWFDEPSERAF